jgi:hypothetical protein
MAVYWVDPYIEAGVGSIHGTTDTASRTGTYSAPWAFSDMFSNAVAGNTNLSGLSDGDEIRLKGLALNSFLVDIGSNWYVSGTNVVKASAVTAADNTDRDATKTITSQTNATQFLMVDKTFSDNWTCANSDGNKTPVFFTCFASSSTTTTISPNSYGGLQTLAQSVLRYKGTTTGTAALQLYSIASQYMIIENTLTSTRYFGSYSGKSLKITDGWTSETVRDGYTLLPLITNATSTRNWYFNHAAANSTNVADTHYDLKNTYFMLQHYNGSSNTAINFYVTSGKRGASGLYGGKDIVQRFGGFISNHSSNNIVDYTAYFFDNAYSNNSADSINSFECDLSVAYYGAYPYARYGDTNNRSTSRFNNCIGYYYIPGQMAQRKTNHYFGTLLFYSSPGYIIADSSSATAANDITILDNAHIFVYTSAGGITQYGHAPLTFAGDVFVYPNGSLSAANVVSSYGPRFTTLVNSRAMYSHDVPFNPTDFKTAAGIYYQAWSTTPHASMEQNVPLRNMTVSGSANYDSDDCEILLKSNMYLFTGTNTSNPGDYNIHFSSNSVDGRPIGLMASYGQNNSYHYPMVYYNDSDKGNALCVKNNTKGVNNNGYKKNIEVPLAAYTSGSTITLKATLETSTNWSSTGYKIYCYYINSSGVLAVTTVANSSVAITTPTDYTTTISGANMIDPPLRHLTFVVDVNNSTSGNKKFWVHELSATVT